MADDEKDAPRRAVNQRLASRGLLLHDLALEVSKANDVAAAARAVVHVGRSLLDSLSAVLWLLDDEGALDLEASDGVPETFVDRWRRILPEDELPAAHAIRTGEPFWVSGADEYRAVNEEIAQRARAANRPMAFAALPMRCEGTMIGLLAFGFEAPHPFTDDEKTLALTVAHHAAQALERARLQAAQRRALAGLRVIAKASETVTAASLDVDATLTALARSVVPDVADWCAVDMFVDGDVRRLTAHHSDPAKVLVARSYAERYRARLDDPKSSLARIFKSGETVWARRIKREMLVENIPDPEQLEILLSLGLRSSVQVALVSEGQVRGVVTFIMSESGREYDETDRDLLEEVGRRAGHALTNASMYMREQRARERMTRLAAVTAELARATTTADVGEAACREGAAALGASVATLYIVDADIDEARLAARFEAGGSRIELPATIPLARDLPITRAIKRNTPVVIESSEALVAEFGEAALEIGTSGSSMPSRVPELAFMCKPLTNRAGFVIGALGFGFSGARTFAEDERAFARTLADHCAQALDRARILDLERIANVRLAVLAAAGEAFSGTTDYEATLDAVVRAALPGLGDFGFFDILEEDGAVRRTSRAHEDPGVAAILAQSRWQRSERTDKNLCALSSGERAIHARIDDAFLEDMATSEGHLAALRALKLCSMITVPVVLRGNLLGALTLCHGRSGRHHTREDLELAGELARRGALAVEQARLYRTVTEAARRAEEANRVKDDFLATVSHELRTPLNAILGWAHLLSGERAADGDFVRRGLDVIRRNASAQRELVDDILDVSRIITGKLRIDPLPIDLAGAINDALDVVRPAAEAKGVKLVSQGLDRTTPFVGDRARLQQVIWNLLANAVKFTENGGLVRAELVVENDRVTIRVSDDGIGIPPEVLPVVFERFRQADSSTTRTHGGLGLGLSIVRHLVELHGGTVSAASEGPGHGATFEVVLPKGLRDTPANAGTPSSRSEEQSSAQASLRDRRILVVDDEVDSREVAELVLRDAGAAVHVVESAEAALALFEKEQFDAVVSDIAMPEVDGYVLIDVLQKKAADTGRPFCAIALTAYGRGEDRTRALRAGFRAYVTKPVVPEELVAAIVGALPPA